MKELTPVAGSLGALTAAGKETGAVKAVRVEATKGLL